MHSRMDNCYIILGGTLTGGLLLMLLSGNKTVAVIAATIIIIIIIIIIVFLIFLLAIKQNHIKIKSNFINELQGEAMGSLPPPEPPCEGKFLGPKDIYDTARKMANAYLETNKTIFHSEATRPAEYILCPDPCKISVSQLLTERAMIQDIAKHTIKPIYGPIIQKEDWER